jgi:uncharacterized protein with HEPN domain
MHAMIQMLICFSIIRKGSLGLFELMDIKDAPQRILGWKAIPWPKVAGIGNVLRHDYEHIAYDVLWRVVHDDLPTLERVCREELAAEPAREP